MKPLYIFLLFFAILITGLADGISVGLSIIPGIGILLDLVITFCINATMGSGLILLLVMNDMYHPTWGPAGSIGGFIPGFNFLPFWLGIVIAGIVRDMSKEKGLMGAAASAVQGAPAAASGNITGALRGAKQVVANTRPAVIAQGPANDTNEPKERAPSTLQTKNFDGIKPYVPKAA